jgi:hypothetical protein
MTFGLQGREASQRAILAAAMKAGSALPRGHHSNRRRAGVPRLSGPASLSGAPETTRVAHSRSTPNVALRVLRASLSTERLELNARS